MSSRPSRRLTAWYRKNHTSAPELWIKLHKKASGLPSVTNVEGFEEALCWGWIDGHPQAVRRAELPAALHAARQEKHLVDAQPGHRRAADDRGPHAAAPARSQIDLAKADGRWDKAYGGCDRRSLPAGPAGGASKPSPAALEMFGTLNAQNRYALGFRTHNMKTPAGRAKKIAGFVEMLKRGETIYPNGKAK